MPIEAGKISPLQNIMTFASMRDVVAMRTLLLKHGANPNLKNAMGETALFKAIKSGMS